MYGIVSIIGDEKKEILILITYTSNSSNTDMHTAKHAHTKWECYYI